MGRKFHHDYSQSDAANQRYRCNPLWCTQLGSGKVSSSSSRTSRTRSSSGGSGSGSSSSDKTRQDKTRQGKARQDKTRQDNSCSISGDTLAIPRRYPKWKTGTPRRQSPSSFQHNHISKFQKGKTQHNPIPNGTDTLGKFRTYKNAGKISMFQTMSSKTPAGRSTHRLPEIFPPN